MSRQRNPSPLEHKVVFADRRPPRSKRRGNRSYFAFAFAASQSALLNDKKPLPLQEFWPWQLLVAVLHADWPLQPLTPSHFTFAASAAFADVKDAVLNNNAAADAMATAENLLDLCI
jgi:hypothetical protein